MSLKDQRQGRSAFRVLASLALGMFVLLGALLPMAAHAQRNDLGPPFTYTSDFTPNVTGFPSAASAGQAGMAYMAAQFGATGSQPKLNCYLETIYLPGSSWTARVDYTGANASACFDDNNYMLIAGTVKSYDVGKNLGTYNCDGGTGTHAGNAPGGVVKGKPINAATGDKFEQDTDYQSPNEWLTFRRFYNSAGSVMKTSLGSLWRHSFDRALTFPQTTSINLFRPDGRYEMFQKANGVWTPDADVADTLTEIDNTSGSPVSYTVRIAGTLQIETYDTTGLLRTIQDPDGQQVTLTYSTSTTPVGTAPLPNLLLTVTDPYGRSLSFTYDSQARLHTVTQPDGGVLTYSYDTVNNLTTVQYPDGKTQQYLYNESGETGGANFPGVLTGQIDETNTRYVTTTYNANGQATSESLAGGVDAVTLSYGATDGSAPTTLTNALGATTSLSFQNILYSLKVGGSTQSCGVGCDQPWASQTYDANGYPLTVTDFNGNVTATTFDANGLLDQEIDAQGNANQRTTTTTWNTTLRLPLTRTVSNANGTIVSSTQWVYNAGGQTLARCDIDPTNSAATGYTCSNTGAVPAGVRRSTYTYCTAVGTGCPIVGLMLTKTGPRTDLTQTTTYSYYTSSSAVSCGTPGSACYQPGDLYKVTDALGHVTTVVSYDADGRPTRITDANGINTDMTYTPRGWLATHLVAGVGTSFTYTAYGAVQTVTDADGVITTYGYDAAHRLNQVTDALGNYIKYTLDAAGDKTGEQVYDASGNVHQQLTRTFNTLGQLTSVVDGLGKTVFNANASGNYDANGNLVQSSDGLGFQRQLGYDALNRLVQTLDNDNGTDPTTKNTTTKYNYDSLDRIIQVTDPSSLNTTYGYDGLSDATGQVSPDTGTSATTYDAAGNPMTHTDAKGIISTSTYDALDRLTSTTYPDSTLNVSYTYDESVSVTGCPTGTAPIGRPSRIIEATVTTVLCYGGHGNLIEKRQILAGQTDTTIATYTYADRLLSVQTPAGSLIKYVRDANGRISSIQLTPVGASAATNAVSAVSYLPFGPVASYTLGNGQTVTRAYDANYRFTDLTSPAFNLHVARDVMGDITAIGNAPGANPATETYAYDPLYRLLSVTEANGSVLESVTYNATGDRLTKTGSGLATGAYSYNPNTHQLIATGSAARSVDANGNTTAIAEAGSTYGFGYNDRNRMAVAQLAGSTVASYTYNALNQRIQKTTSSATERYDYNATGQMLGEYGATNRDYIWMGGIPIANVDTNGATSTISYVTADELGTPRAIADSSGNTIWQLPYQGNPWDEVAPTSNGYTYNLRFSGQYFDAETGEFYNGARYYNSGIGGFDQPDPIGQAGGIGIYVYGLDNPLINNDPLGLQTNINMFPKNTNDWVGANNYQTPPGIFTVGAHGNPLDIVDENNMPLYPSELANIIKHNKAYKPGEPVRLLSCNTGRDPGKPYSPIPYAQFLANDLGAPVQAPNTFGWFLSDGTFTIAGAQNANGPVQWNQTGINPNNIFIDLNAPGTMNTFTPKN
jgi:RHS repeat-associated protein